MTYISKFLRGQCNGSAVKCVCHQIWQPEFYLQVERLLQVFLCSPYTLLVHRAEMGPLSHLRS